MQSATIAQTQDSQEVTGKQGRKLTSLKRNKAVTISGNNGLVSGGLLELQTGGTFENKATEVMWTDYLTVNNNTATTSFRAVGTTGNEIESAYIRNEDGTRGTELTQSSEAGSGMFKYNPATKALDFSGIENGTEIVVYYKRNITANVLDNESDSYSGKCALYIDAFAEDKCANIYRIQFYIPKADFSGEFSFEMGDSQTVHAFEAEALAGACGAGGTLWTYTIFGSEADDETVKVNEDALNMAIAEAASTYAAGNAGGKYESTSWDAFKSAFEAAAACTAANYDLSEDNQEAVDDALESLKAAHNGLKLAGQAT